MAQRGDARAAEVHEEIGGSVGETAYRRLRGDLIFGRVAPGAKLRLDAMRAEYGVGVSTLREILSRLAAEGFVLAEGQRGFEVPPLTARNLVELAELRLTLERHALRRSFAVGDMEWEGRVVGAHHKLDIVERRMLDGARETELWKRYDCEFHQALISACGSLELMAAHANAFDRYLRYLMVSFSFRGSAAAAEHRALRDCALARDAEGAIAVLTGHIDDCVAFTLTRERLSG